MYDMSYPTTTGGNNNSTFYDNQTQPSANELHDFGNYVNGGIASSQQEVYCQQNGAYQQQYSTSAQYYYNQQNAQQLGDNLACYGSYQPGDYTDVNSLEPSLVPGQMAEFSSAYNQQMNANNAYFYHHNSPTGSAASSHTSTGSDESDDYFGWQHHPYKKSPAELEVKVKRAKQTKKRKPKRDPNEPQKPVSAYALFFRDTQATIKGQSPNATFGEVSKIVASMWDTLPPDTKNNYKQKTETAKKDYLKQLAAYRANMLSKNGGGTALDCLGQQEFAQAQQKLLSQNQSSPDSTTQQGDTVKDSLPSNVGLKSLASLIAEPAPQQVLTATTTLTVPQAYFPSRTKTEFDECNDVEVTEEVCTTAAAHNQSQMDNANWERQFRPNEGLVQHCRDVFSIWGQPRQSVQPVAASSSFAQV